MIQCANLCGFETKPSKTVGPCQQIEFLGVLIDSVNKKLSITKDRIKYVCDELDEWLMKSRCKKRELLALLGRLNFCSQVIMYGSLFVRRLIHASKQVNELYHIVILDSECKKDIKWWRKNLQHNCGVSWFPRPFDVNTAVIMYCDAAKGAAAAVVGNSWTVQHFDGEFAWMQDKNIAVKELYAIVLGISTFAVRLRGRQVLMHTDNKAIDDCIEAGKSKDVWLNCLLRSLYYYSSLYQIEYRSCHVPGISNVLADSLSRDKQDVFRFALPGADHRMTRPCRFTIDF